MKNIKLYEEFIFESAPSGCRIPWPKLAKEIKGQTIMGTDYLFTDYIEKIPTNGATFTNPKSKSYVNIYPDGKYDIFKPDPSRKGVGIGVASGTWSCVEFPGGGVNITLGKETKFLGTSMENSPEVKAEEPFLNALHNNLKSSGFKMDLKGKTMGGQPTIYKGDDTNGVSVIFTPKGWRGMTPKSKYKIVVTVGGRNKMNKEYPAGKSSVSMIVKDLSPWRDYPFTKGGPMG